MLLIAYMVLAYIALAGSVVYLSIRYVRLESKHVRRPVLRTMSAVTRLYFILRLTLSMFRKSFTYLLIADLLLTVLIASYAAVPTQAVTKLSSMPAEGGAPALLIVLSRPAPVSCSSMISSLKDSPLISGGMNCSEFLRVSLTKPAMINISKSPIYIIIGVSDAFLTSHLGKAGFYYGSQTRAGSEAVNLTLPSGNGVLINLHLVGEDEIRDLTIYDSIPLLPVQSYLGAKPVLPPPKYVLVGPIDKVRGILGTGVTDILISGVSINASSLTSLLTALSLKYPVSRIYYFSPEGTYLASGTQIPTLRSLSTAMLSAGIMAVLAIALFTSIKPYISNLYRKLTLQGFPPWGMRIVLLSYIAVLTLMVISPTLGGVYLCLGGVSTLNGLVAALITWIVVSAYISKEVRVPSLMSNVYVPPARKYALMTSLRDVGMLADLITSSLRSNEFFRVEGIEERVGSDGALLHCRLSYNESWGSGADVNIVISRGEDLTTVSINTSVWGVEEVSDVIINEMVSLITSRIVGVVKSWEQLH